MNSHWNRRIAVFVFVACLLFGAFGSLMGQIPRSMSETTGTGLGGTNFIVGTVFWPSGRPVNRRMRIRLSSMMIEVVAMTDDAGKFVFSGIVNGNYYISIDGEPDFEPLTQFVEVTQFRTDPRQVYTLSLRLIEKKNTTVRPAVVSTATTGVPKRAMDLYNKALELSRNRDHKGAIEQLELAIAQYPAFMLAFNELGVQYLKLNELGKADEALQRALKLDPNAYEPLANRGIVLFRLERHSEAEGALLRVIGANSRSAVAHFYLGRTYMAMQRTDDAIKALNETVAVGGDAFKEAHRLLAVLYLDKGDRRRVVEELEAYLKLVPDAKDADELRLVIKQNKAAGPPK